MRTYVPKAAGLRHDWYVLDAKDQILGRLATRAAMLLMGKNKPDYTPFLKTGDHVIVINAGQVKLTGKKEDQKKYYRHSGYPGGIKQVGLREMRAKHPDRIIRQAVLGMLPKNKLGKQLATRLKVYAESKHPHEAQKPQALAL